MTRKKRELNKLNCTCLRVVGEPRSATAVTSSLKFKIFKKTNRKTDCFFFWCSTRAEPTNQINLIIKEQQAIQTRILFIFDIIIYNSEVIVCAHLPKIPAGKSYHKKIGNGKNKNINFDWPAMETSTAPVWPIWFRDPKGPGGAGGSISNSRV